MEIILLLHNYFDNQMIGCSHYFIFWGIWGRQMGVFPFYFFFLLLHNISNKTLSNGSVGSFLWIEWGCKISVKGRIWRPFCYHFLSTLFISIKTLTGVFHKMGQMRDDVIFVLTRVGETSILFDFWDIWGRQVFDPSLLFSTPYYVSKIRRWLLTAKSLLLIGHWICSMSHSFIPLWCLVLLNWNNNILPFWGQWCCA